MRVVFDFDTIAANKFSGFRAYGAGLIRGFSKLPEIPEIILLCSRRFKREFLEFEKNYPGFLKCRTAAVKIRWLENIWRYIGYPRLEQLTGNFDIYHCVHHLMPPAKGKPRIMTVHDLRRYKLPELYEKSRLWRFELAVKRADYFLAVSQSTKKDLCEIFGVSPDKVDVTHLAADENFLPLTDIEKNRLKVKLSEQIKTPISRFVMAISSSDERKNIYRTVKAFKSSTGKLPKETKLVVVGKLPKFFGSSEAKAFSDDNIFWTGPVDNLTEWLSCADAIVYASLYEGFGIPILEAFACGVPVITSNCSSMPEVAGNAAILVDPYDEKAIGQAIAEVCSDAQKRTKMAKAGLQRNREFTWEKTALKTFEVYKRFI
jgi:glycosyltransferase involved in cell wall biosynthesis